MKSSFCVPLILTPTIEVDCIVGIIPFPRSINVRHCCCSDAISPTFYEKKEEEELSCYDIVEQSEELASLWSISPTFHERNCANILAPKEVQT
jgi:hypothetical protein